MKKGIRLISQRKVQFLGAGISYLAYVTLSLFPYQLCAALAGIILLCSVSLTLFCNSKTTEPDDEMSRLHLLKAKATAQDLTQMIILLLFICLLFLSLFDVSLSPLHQITFSEIPFWALLIPFFYGINNLLTGIFFVRYERAGE